MLLWRLSQNQNLELVKWDPPMRARGAMRIGVKSTHRIGLKSIPLRSRKPEGSHGAFPVAIPGAWGWPD